MRKGSLLVLAVAIFSAQAISQEIVIEPTNGHAPSAKHVSRPAALEATPVAKPPKPAPQEQRAQKPPTKRHAGKEVALNSKSSAVAKPAPAAPEVAKNEVPQAAPPRKVLPARPAWAMSDTRDARSIQSEIANAMARDPKLVGSSVDVKVDEDSVTMSGRAAGIDERLQAERLAQSYAWNRKLVDHLELVPRVSAQK